MINILVNAYAVCPRMGSEPGMGWSWTTNLAQHCELFVITESEFREEIEAELALAKAEGRGRYVTRQQAERMHFYYNTIGGSEERAAVIRRKCWNQGTWSFYVDYAKWQRDTLRIAKEIISREHIDVMHQLNMVGFRESGLLWKIDGIPLVWGPFAGIGSIPFPFMRDGGLKFTAFYTLKNIISACQLRWMPKIRGIMRRAEKVIAATPYAAKEAGRVHRREVLMIPETGCYPKENGVERHDFLNRKRFKVIWVGRFMFTKRLDLALKTISRLKERLSRSAAKTALEFHIVGQAFNETDNVKMRQMAENLGIDAICRWHGQIPNEEVQRLMQECDVFFFSSIFEATSTVTLEAIQNSLPVVCFDACGMSAVVNDKVGVKIPYSNPKQAIRDFCQALAELEANRERLATMSANCRQRAEELSWDKKARKVLEIYEELIAENAPRP